METKVNKVKKGLYLFLGVLLVIGIAFRLKNNKEKTQNKVFHYNKEKPLFVDTEILQKENIAEDFAYLGTFEPFKESKLASESQGKIKAVLVDVGSVVKKGQVLLQLDNSLLKLQLQSVDIQIEGIESEVKRFEILSRGEAIQAVQLEKAQLALKTAKIQKATLIEQLEKTSVKAPFEGVITAKLMEEGGYAAPGIPVLQLTDINQLRYTIQVPETDLSHFVMGQKYSIIVDALGGSKMAAKLCMVGSKSNTGNNFPIQFLVDNTANQAIKAGMFGRLSLIKEYKEKGIVVPSSVLVGSSNQPKIYKVINGKARLFPVVVGKRTANKVMISSGLKAGDRIVTNGFVQLFEGANVVVK